MALSTGIVAMLLAALATGGVWVITGTFSFGLLFGLGLTFFAAILTLRLLTPRSGSPVTPPDGNALTVQPPASRASR